VFAPLVGGGGGTTLVELVGTGNGVAVLQGAG